MTPDTWNAVEQFIVDELIPNDPALESALARSAQAGLPAISVTPNFGKLLYLLARLQGARRILEIGTLGGYSTIWLARALPEDGRLVTLELEEKHAEVAKKNIARAGLASRVELRLGPAAQSLEALHGEGVEAFDFIFIDADKPSNPVYLEGALKLARAGTILVVDNVIREGDVIDAKSKDASVQGTRRLFDLMAANPRLDATALQTVGSKGYDGFVVAVVRD